MDTISWEQQDPHSNPNELQQTLDYSATLPSNDSHAAAENPDIANSVDDTSIDQLIGTYEIDLDEFVLSDGFLDQNEHWIYTHLSNHDEQSQSQEISESDNSINSNELTSIFLSPPSVASNHSPLEVNTRANLLAVQARFQQQQEMLYRMATDSTGLLNDAPHSTTVEPTNYFSSSTSCQPCTTVEMFQDLVYQQQLNEYDRAESKTIKILCQPRAKYRPRTQNESNQSSHYVRCEEGVRPDYPTISIPPEWNFQSDINLIEVALVGIDKELHPYSLINKNSSAVYDDNALIFKQNVPSILFFRLTNEDFVNRCKTFMLEIIKSKQDQNITKDLIRSRQLEHSLLRFTRLFKIGKEQFQRDEGTVEYSCVMSEAYGDVEVEHIGPQYGPMCGQEMVYAILKGRILKNELNIQLVENTNNWIHTIEDFTKNGNIVYFLMPACPIQNIETFTVNIVVYYKSEEISRTSYLYKGSLDQELAALRLNDSSEKDSQAVTPSQYNPFNLFMATGIGSTTSVRRRSTFKQKKRLVKHGNKN